MRPLAIYGSHDSSICISPAPNEYRIYEFERLVKKRYCNISQEEKFEDYILEVKRLIEEEYGVWNWGSCFFAQLEKDKRDILQKHFGFNHFEEISHHYAHAAGALYQSSFDQALIISSDSGGHEMEDGVQTFCLFIGDKTQPMNHVIKKLANLPIDVCGAYTLMAIPIREIHKEDAFTKYLSYAGKIMGLAAYGKVRDEWIDPMAEFYYGNIRLETLKELGEQIDLDLSGINTIEGKDAYDLAATSQYVFEQITYAAIVPFFKKYKLPVILTGGGALNVLFNYFLYANLHPQKMFVPANPNDCGLSFGMMMLREPASKPVDISLCGFDILDRHDLLRQVHLRKAKEVDVKEVARLICKGKIIGVLRNRSECGPRALGNRSILCDPSFPGMKDELNLKVKFREFYRPFAPVVKLEDVYKYFLFDNPSEFMSYAPKIRNEYRERVPSIVHKDSTARLQTVTTEQNQFMYDLIDHVETIKGIGMVLNTSFNIKGLPILTTIEDALHVLDNTSLDYVLIENYLFSK